MRIKGKVNTSVLAHLLDCSSAVLNSGTVTEQSVAKGYLLAILLIVIAVKLVACVLKGLLCSSLALVNGLEVLDIVWEVVVIASCPVRPKHGAWSVLFPVNTLEDDGNDSCRVNDLAECLTNCNILKSTASRVKLDNSNRHTKTTTNLSLITKTGEVRKKLSRTCDGRTGSVSLFVLECVNGSLGIHLLVDKGIKLRSVTPPLWIWLEGYNRVIERINNIRTRTKLVVWLIVVTIVEEVWILKLWVQSITQDALDWIDWLLHGNNSGLSSIALFNRLILVITIS